MADDRAPDQPVAYPRSAGNARRMVRGSLRERPGPELPPGKRRPVRSGLVQRQQRPAIETAFALAEAIAGIVLRDAIRRRVGRQAGLEMLAAIHGAALPAGVGSPDQGRLGTAW